MHLGPSSNQQEGDGAEPNGVSSEPLPKRHLIVLHEIETKEENHRSDGCVHYPGAVVF